MHYMPVTTRQGHRDHRVLWELTALQERRVQPVQEFKVLQEQQDLQVAKAT